eukprot:CAMPEP_0182862050 /NCGR_PEP_ID=MMETSP0034_2-20130328/5844_1 /TAXON_ID=156128 /ORGANISM="Nephroselmis pyriformis, Strain CCMP717" /LENGTH=315 /DNA_ID=CAMNT_0024994055 /DNA_START=251 /DNA_END=1196 /DNA_ORIENTATION=-
MTEKPSRAASQGPPAPSLDESTRRQPVLRADGVAEVDGFVLHVLPGLQPFLQIRLDVARDAVARPRLLRLERAELHQGAPALDALEVRDHAGPRYRLDSVPVEEVEEELEAGLLAAARGRGRLDLGDAVDELSEADAALAILVQASEHERPPRVGTQPKHLAHLRELDRPGAVIIRHAEPLEKVLEGRELHAHVPDHCEGAHGLPDALLHPHVARPARQFIHDCVILALLRGNGLGVLRLVRLAAAAAHGPPGPVDCKPQPVAPYHVPAANNAAAPLSKRLRVGGGELLLLGHWLLWGQNWGHCYSRARRQGVLH